jgi:hypothetical protein
MPHVLQLWRWTVVAAEKTQVTPWRTLLLRSSSSSQEALSELREKLPSNDYVETLYDFSSPVAAFDPEVFLLDFCCCSAFDCVIFRDDCSRQWITQKSTRLSFIHLKAPLMFSCTF